MPEKVVQDKVLCYVVRDGRLLVFRHTDYSYEEVEGLVRERLSLGPALAADR